MHPSRSHSLISLLLILSASPLPAIYLNEASMGLGYRRDYASFDVCATLADGTSQGCGQTRYRGLNLAEVGLRMEMALTSRFIVTAEGRFSEVVTGKFTDSGLADITSNPGNSLLGASSSICCPWNCLEVDCPTCCPLSNPVPLVPVSGHAKGNCWDGLAYLGFVSHPSSSSTFTLLGGYSFDQQRFIWKDTVWGPLELTELQSPCSGAIVPGTIGLQSCSAALLYGPDPCACSSSRCSTSCCDSTDPVFDCVGFGQCFDEQLYRARWQTGFAGAELAWDPSPAWHLRARYAYHWGRYDGLFEALQIDCDSVRCPCCPTSYPACADSTSSPAVGALVGTTMSVRTPCQGQQVALALDWGHAAWRCGLQLGWNLRWVDSCHALDPCSACIQVCAGSADSAPLWSDALLTRARWESFDGMITITRLF